MGAQSLIALTLFVADVDRSAEFYRILGCGVFEWNEPGHARHFDAATRDTLIQLFPSGERHAISSVQLGLRVGNVDEVAVALQRAGAAVEIPGPKRLTTTDPDGNRVHLTEAHQ